MRGFFSSASPQADDRQRRRRKMLWRNKFLATIFVFATSSTARRASTAAAAATSRRPSSHRRGQRIRDASLRTVMSGCQYKNLLKAAQYDLSKHHDRLDPVVSNRSPDDASSMNNEPIKSQPSVAPTKKLSKAQINYTAWEMQLSQRNRNQIVDLLKRDYRGNACTRCAAARVAGSVPPNVFYAWSWYNTLLASTMPMTDILRSLENMDYSAWTLTEFDLFDRLITTQMTFNLIT